MDNGIASRIGPRMVSWSALALSVILTVCLASPALAGSRSKKDAAAEAEKAYEKEMLSKKSDRPFLGVNMQELDDELRKGLDVDVEHGVLISEVIEGGPAQEAGIEDGDVIVEFNGKRVDSPSGLRELVGGLKVGDAVKVKVISENKPKTLTVTLGEYPEEESWSFFEPEQLRWLNDGTHAFVEAVGKGRLGVQVTDLNEDLAPYFGVKEGEGVLVLDVTRGSVGEKMGIKAGDVITQVSGEKIESAGDLKKVMGEVEGGERFDVALVRSKKDVALQGEMDEDLAKFYSGSTPHKILVRPRTLEGHAVPDIEVEKLKMEFKQQMKELQKEIENLKVEIEKVKKST